MRRTPGNRERIKERILKERIHKKKILQDLKMRAVVRGSRILMITAANRFGLYSAFLEKGESGWEE
jgi:hypothetical protein